MFGRRKNWCFKTHDFEENRLVWAILPAASEGSSLESPEFVSQDIADKSIDKIDALVGTLRNSLQGLADEFITDNLSWFDALKISSQFKISGGQLECLDDNLKFNIESKLPSVSTDHYTVNIREYFSRMIEVVLRLLMYKEQLMNNRRLQKDVAKQSLEKIGDIAGIELEVDSMRHLEGHGEKGVEAIVDDLKKIVDGKEEVNLENVTPGNLVLGLFKEVFSSSSFTSNDLYRTASWGKYANNLEKHLLQFFSYSNGQILLDVKLSKNVDDGSAGIDLSSGRIANAGEEVRSGWVRVTVEPDKLRGIVFSWQRRENGQMMPYQYVLHRPGANLQMPNNQNLQQLAGISAGKEEEERRSGIVAFELAKGRLSGMEGRRKYLELNVSDKKDRKYQLMFVSKDKAFEVFYRKMAVDGRGYEQLHGPYNFAVLPKFNDLADSIRKVAAESDQGIDDFVPGSGLWAINSIGMNLKNLADDELKERMGRFV